MKSDNEEFLPFDYTLVTGKFDPREEGIIGEDGRRKVENTRQRPWCQVCSLEYWDGEQWTPYATGWIAARRLIVTAAHNLFDPRDSDKRLERIRVCPGRVRADAPYPHGVYESNQFVAAWEGTGEEPSRQNDFAAIFLDKKLPRRLGTLDLLNPASSGDLINHYVTVSGYPVDRDFCQQQYRHEDVVLGIENDKILYRADTNRGQSGAPVLLMNGEADQLYVVGIHAGENVQSSADESSGVPGTGVPASASTCNSGPFLSPAIVSQIEDWKQQSEAAQPGLLSRITNRMFGR